MNPTMPDKPGWLTPRRIATIALGIATLGLAIPYGFHDPTTPGLHPTEWAITIAAGLATIALVVELLGRWRTQPWAFAATGFVWSFDTVYGLFVIHATPQAHIGIALPSLGWAVLSFLVWRQIVVTRHREEQAWTRNSSQPSSRRSRRSR